MNLKHLKRNEKGQALVEFALVITIFIMLVFGMVEFGRIFSAKLITTHAAREGARVGVVTASADRRSEIEKAVEGRGVALGLKAGDIDYEPADPKDANKGDSLTVTVNYKVDLIVPMISKFLNDKDPYPVSSSAVMRVE